MCQVKERIKESKKSKTPNTRGNEKNHLRATCRFVLGKGHRSFYCAKGGVYTHYNRSIMANADVYTQREKRRHRVCGVWSPLISDRLDGYCRPPPVSLSLFFMEPYVCRAPRPRAHLSAGNLPLCCDLMAAVKTHGPYFHKLQARSRSRSWNLEISSSQLEVTSENGPSLRTIFGGALLVSQFI